MVNAHLIAALQKSSFQCSVSEKSVMMPFIITASYKHKRSYTYFTWFLFPFVHLSSVCLLLFHKSRSFQRKYVCVYAHESMCRPAFCRHTNAANRISIVFSLDEIENWCWRPFVLRCCFFCLLLGISSTFYTPRYLKWAYFSHSPFLVNSSNLSNDLFTRTADSLDSIKTIHK